MLRTAPTTHGAELLLNVIKETFDGVAISAAAYLEIHTSQISHLVSGRKRPSLELAVHLQRAFDIPCLTWLEPPRGIAA